MALLKSTPTVRLKKADADRILSFKAAAEINENWEITLRKVLNPTLVSFFQQKLSMTRTALRADDEYIRSASTIFERTVLETFSKKIVEHAPWLSRANEGVLPELTLMHDHGQNFSLHVLLPHAANVPRGSGTSFLEIRLGGDVDELIAKLPALQEYLTKVQVFLWKNRIPLEISAQFFCSLNRVEAIKDLVKVSPTKPGKILVGTSSHDEKTQNPHIRIHFMFSLQCLSFHNDVTSYSLPSSAFVFPEKLKEFRENGLKAILKDRAPFPDGSNLLLPFHWLTPREMRIYLLGALYTGELTHVDLPKVKLLGVNRIRLLSLRHPSWFDTTSSLSVKIAGASGMNSALRSVDDSKLSPIGQEIKDLMPTDITISPRAALLFIDQFFTMVKTLSRLSYVSSIENLLPEGL